MARSDSSDSGRSHKHSKNKKKSKRRSRSNSNSSDDRNRKSKKSKSDRKDRRRSRSRERRRSRSRDRKKSRSRSRSRERKRVRSHSRSRERNRSRSRSRDRDRRRSRSRSKDKSRKMKEESAPIKQHSSGWDESGKSQTKTTSGWDAKPSQFDNDLNSIETDDKLSLREKIKLLTGQSNPTEVPTSEELGKIEQENFIQEKFTSTYIDPSNQPKQKKKKKNKQKNIQQMKSEVKEEPVKEEPVELISHEDAMFGSTEDTLHVSRFSTRIDMKRKEELKSVEADDLIFGAMFYDKPEVRMKRWITKLKIIRERLLEKK